MTLVTTKDMLKKANKEGYAIGAFNINNMELVQAITEAAEEAKSPIILQASTGAIKYMGIPYIIKIVEAAVIEHKNVPIALHLDHGPDFETCKACIDAGFTSVMIDGSKYSFEENIALTKKVVDYAHKKGVSVEAELGKINGLNSENFTDPLEAKEFVEKTGCDSLAISIGTSHGAYKFNGKAELRFDILEKIKKEIPDTPIVLHGASSVSEELIEMCNENYGNIKGAKGVPEEILKKASGCGVTKINVDTDVRLALTAGIRKIFKEEPELYDMRKYMGYGREVVKETVKHKIINVFGSNNKIN